MAPNRSISLRRSSLRDHLSISRLFSLMHLSVCRPTPRVEWKKKDGSLGETSGHLDNFDRSLIFNSIAQSDDGEYECQATNSQGSITHSFTVTVEGGRLQRTRTRSA